LKTHENKKVAPMTVRMKPTMKGSEKTPPETGPCTSKRGTCQKPWSRPRMVAPTRGPYFACNRGRAKPRQPVSSPTVSSRLIPNNGRYRLKSSDQRVTKAERKEKP